MGVITPVGNDLDTFWQSLIAGRSGVGPITHFDTTGYRTSFACEVKDYDPEGHFDRREVKRIDRYAQFFMIAVRQALSDSKLSYAQDDPAAARAGVVVGAGFGGMISFAEEINLLRDRGPDRVSPTGIPRIIANMAAGLASIDPLSLFPYRRNNHYNVTGSALVADTVLKSLPSPAEDPGGRHLPDLRGAG